MSAHGGRRPRWNGRWAKNAGIALAPLCALAALLVVGAQTRQLVPALVAYGAGAAAGLVAGLLLGGVTGTLWLWLRRRSGRTPLTPDSPSWVLHRSTPAAPSGRLVHR